MLLNIKWVSKSLEFTVGPIFTDTAIQKAYASELPLYLSSTTSVKMHLLPYFVCRYIDWIDWYSIYDAVFGGLGFFLVCNTRIIEREKRSSVSHVRAWSRHIKMYLKGAKTQPQDSHHESLRQCKCSAVCKTILKISWIGRILHRLCSSWEENISSPILKVCVSVQPRSVSELNVYWHHVFKVKESFDEAKLHVSSTVGAFWGVSACFPCVEGFGSWLLIRRVELSSLCWGGCLKFFLSSVSVRSAASFLACLRCYAGALLCF